MKKESATGDNRQTQERNTGTKTPPSNIYVPLVIGNRHAVKDYLNVHYCRFLHKYVCSCADSSCSYADSCEAFNKGDD